MIPIKASYTPPGNALRQEEVTIVDILLDRATGDIIFVFVTSDGHLNSSTEFDAFSDCELQQ